MDGSDLTYPSPIDARRWHLAHQSGSEYRAIAGQPNPAGMDREDPMAAGKAKTGVDENEGGGLHVDQ